MRKVISVTIAILMVLSLMVPLKAQTFGRSEGIVKSNQKTEALEKLESQIEQLIEAGELEEDERLNYVVLIDGRTNYEKAPVGVVSENGMQLFSASSFKERNHEELKSFVDRRIEEQNHVLNNIFNTNKSNNNGIRAMAQNRMSKKNDFSNIRRFKSLVNGFVLENLTYEEARKIALVPGVKSITAEVKIKRPVETRENQRPLMRNSRLLVKASESVARGYDGTGRVVAIIDSGADVDHQDLIIKDTDKVKLTKNKVDELISRNSMRGKYYNPKFPYGYNYYDRNFNIKDTGPLGMHGQHVAGTIAGNGDPGKAESVVGIVPEAQLLVMRVFGEYDSLTGTTHYTEALDDAVLLGADSVNMSLGGPAGAVKNDPVFEEAVEKAKEAGVIVAMANGNEGYTLSGLEILPLADNVEWSTASSPATMKDSLAVASINNSAMNSLNTIEYDGEKINTTAMSSIDTAIYSGFEYDKEYEFVYIGISKDQSEYAGKEVAGKIAVVKRGHSTFTQKIQMAMDAGAVAVIVGDDGREGEAMYTMTTSDNLIPAFFISQSALEKIIEDQTKKIKITKNPSVFESPSKGKMSKFTSWGPTPSLELKPEITAPGGDIRSTLNDNKYGYMSGTSMATPHVAGGISVAMKRLEDLNIAAVETRFDYAKSILMLTADPIISPEESSDESLYYSPRIQGAGMMNLDKLTTSNFVFITDNGENISKGKSKIEFQNLASDEFEINVNLKNFAEKDVKYEVYVQIQTDKIVEGENTMTPFLLKKDKIGEVEVSANGKANFNATVEFDSPEFETPNGFFVDGFVFFKPVGDNSNNFKVLSLPFLGFRGNYSDAPVIEKFIDEFDFQSEKPFWFRNEEINGGLEEYDAHYTHFVIERLGIANSKPYEDTLGRTADRESFTNKFAFSPNNDGYQDFIKFKGVFLRNYSNFGMRVLDNDENEINFIQNFLRKDGKKVMYTLSAFNRIQSITENVWTWDGRDTDGNIVPDGKYFVNVEVSPGEFPDDKQILKKEIIIDTVEPTIESASAKMVGNELVLEAKGVRDETSGIYSVFMVQDDDRWFELSQDDDGDWIYKEEIDHDFKLEEAKVVFKVVDWAGNIKVFDINEEKGEGSLTIKKVNNVYPEDIPNNIIEVYKKLDDESYSEKPVTNLDKLPMGQYVIQFKDLPSDYIVKYNPSNEFEITDKNKNVEIEIEFEKIDSNSFANLNVEIIWPGDYNGQIKVFAVNEEGDKFQLYRKHEWSDILFSAKLPAGNYTVIAKGYNKFLELNIENNNVGITLEENEDKYIKMQAIWEMCEIPVFVKVENNPEFLAEIFEDENFEKLEDGFVLKKPENFFEIINIKTDTSLFKTTSIYEYYDKKPGTVFVIKEEDQIKFRISAPYGEYSVRLIGYDSNNYIVYGNPVTIEAASIEDMNNNRVDWKGLFIEKKSQDKGSFKIEESFIGSDKNKADLDRSYLLVNELKEKFEVNDFKIDSIAPGSYTLYVTNNNQTFNPERYDYKFNIEPGEEFVLNVRWEDLSLNKKNRSNVVVSMMGEKPPVDELTIRFTNDAGEVVEDKLSLLDGKKSSTTLLNFGVYDFEVIGLPEDYRLELQYIENGNITNQNKRNTKMTIVVDQAWYGIEYAIRKQKIETVEADLTIIEKGNDGNIGKYTLIGENYEKTQKRLKFINLKPGKYVLKVEAPEGYEAQPEVNLEIVKGENTYTIEYKKIVENEEEPTPEPKPEPQPEPQPKDPGHFYEPSPDRVKKQPKREEKKEEPKEEPKKEETEGVKEKEDYGVEIPEKIAPIVFEDVLDEQKEVVDFVTSYQIIKGTDQNTFKPNDPISRAMVVQTLMRIAKDKNISTAVKFNDVPVDQWYTDSVYWATTHGYVLGDDKGNFHPNTLLTRQEFALIISRFLKVNGITLDKIKNFEVSDEAAIPAWSKEAVIEMAEKGIVEPSNSLAYNPTSNVTRFELARALNIIIEWIQRQN